MDPHAPQSLLSSVHRLFADERRRQASDRDLLQAFVQRRENDAFAELLRRHGPMVLNLALHLLHHRQDAEDVFQAAFLTLARQAHSLRNESSVAAWLHRVAWRLAVRSRAASQRRNHPLPISSPSPQRDPADEISLRESQEWLHQELAALPEHLRLPLVLCYLQGRTRDEAARRLGWSLGTLKRRLVQGRKLLHARLSRRGVELPAVLSGSLFAAAEVPASLAASTLGLATSSLAGSASVPASVAILLAEMSWSVKAKALWGLVLMLSACAGAGAWIYYGQSTEPAAPPEARPADNPSLADKGEKTPVPPQDRFGDPLPPGALARMGTVRFRHGGTISAISLSADGRVLASAGFDQTVLLWDIATGRELRRLPSHEDPVNYSSSAVAFSPDGKILATIVSLARNVHLWDAATTKELRKLPSPYELLGRLAFSVDGKTVAAAGVCHRIAVWDAATGRLLHQLDGGDDKLQFAAAIAFSPDGRLLASGGWGETYRLWNVKTGKEERRFLVQPPWWKEKIEADFSGIVEAVAFSPDGRILASAARDAPIRLWDVATGKEIRSWRGGRYGANVLAFSPDGKTLASAEIEGVIRLWETASGKEVRQIQVDKGSVSGLAFSRDGQTLAAGVDSAIRLWEVRSGTEISPDRGHSIAIDSSVLLPDGQTLITAGNNGVLRWWEAATGKELRRLGCPSKSFLRFVPVIVSPNGTVAAYAATKSVGNTHEVHVGIELWDLIARKKLALLWRPNIKEAHFSPDSKTLFASGWDVKQRVGFIVSWDVATGKERGVVARGTSFDSFSLSADGKIVAASFRDRKEKLEKTICLWDAVTGKELCRPPAKSAFDQRLAISADDKLLAVADGPSPWPPSPDKGRALHQPIRLWDIASGKEVRRFEGSSHGYWAAVFSADGKTLATAGEDNQIRLWESATGGERLHLAGHAGGISSLIFADKDRTLISTSSDTTALVWDITGTRRPVLAPDRQRSSPRPQELWSALANPDAAASYRAMCRLIAAPAKAIALLRPHLKPVEGVDEKRIERLIADLDSDVFAVREKATKELRKLGELAEPACRQALAARPAVEMRRRLQELLDDIEPHQWHPSPELLRQLRALEVLERIGTPEARKLLETLAGGAAGAWLTREARAVVQRLRKAEPRP